MKVLVLLLLVNFTGNPEPAGSAFSFDRFTELLYDALDSGDPDIYEMFISDRVRFIHPGGQPDSLSFGELLVLLENYGRPDRVLRHLASGFVRVDCDEGPSFVSLHNGGSRHQLIRVNGNAVRLRKMPGTKSPVIAQFDKGIYSAIIAHDEVLICDARTGTEWLRVQIKHPQLGLLSGYISNDYITVLPSDAPKAVKVELVNGQWMITELSAL